MSSDQDEPKYEEDANRPGQARPELNGPERMYVIASSILFVETGRTRLQGSAVDLRGEAVEEVPIPAMRRPHAGRPFLLAKLLVATPRPAWCARRILNPPKA